MRPPGEYEFRLFAQESFNLLATSNAFTVSNASSQPERHADCRAAG
jgi:hypothetical protein